MHLSSYPQSSEEGCHTLWSALPTRKGCSWGSPELRLPRTGPTSPHRQFRFSRLSRMSPTTRPGSSGKCREVRQDHSFRDSTCIWGSGISGKAGRGEPGAHLAALLMVLSPVPCNLGIQSPQGPRPPLGPHITDHHTCHKQAASSYSGPLCRRAINTLHSSWAGTGREEKWETDTSSHPLSRARRQGAAFLQACGDPPQPPTSQWGLHGDMQIPKFLAESYQPAGGHHRCSCLVPVP